jgi:hypothetical protein
MQRFIGIITCSCDKLASMMFYKREGKGKVSCTLIRTGHRHSGAEGEGGKRRMRQGGAEGRQTWTLKEENTSAAERMEKSGKGSCLRQGESSLDPLTFTNKQNPI